MTRPSMESRTGLAVALAAGVALLAALALLTGAAVQLTHVWPIGSSEEEERVWPTADTAELAIRAATANDADTMEWLFGRPLDERELETVRYSANAFPSATIYCIRVDPVSRTSGSASYECTLWTSDLYSVSRSVVTFEESDDGWRLKEIRAIE